MGHEDLLGGPDDELLLQLVVKSATKSEVTVEEAPTTVHVVTSGDIASFGHRNLLDSLLLVPGFLEANAQYDQIPLWMILGVAQGLLYLRDGMSMFDPIFNAPALMRRIPVETIGRVEAMSSPGGVLWGANSFLGIANVMTKEPEDVRGLIMALGGGHGRGDEGVIRPYILWGQTFFGGQLGVLAHWSLEWFKGPRYRVPEPWVVSSPSELDGSSSFRHPDGLLTSTPTSFYSQFDGKVTYGKLGGKRRITLAWQVAFHKMPNLIDSARKKRWVFWDGIHRPIGFWAVPIQSDSPNPAVSHNTLNWHDSFLSLRHQEQWLDGRLALDSRLYYVRFKREAMPFVYLPYTNDLMPGAAARVSAAAHRGGASLDMRATLWQRFGLQALFGGELFYEWVKDTQSQFIAPLDGSGQLNYDLLRILGCPYTNVHGDNIPVYDPRDPSRTTYLAGCRQPFIFDADRMVYAAYVSLQGKPHKHLLLDGGVRVQHGPLGNVTYTPQILYSGAVVYRAWEDLYLKANVATGFRPPVFNATSSNVAGGNWAGDPTLEPEKSRALRGEVTFTPVKSKKGVRRLTLRAAYSYTLLENMIRMIGGTYFNTADRDIHAVEALTDLHLAGGHRLLLTYTWARQQGSSPLDGGISRSVPNHWFTGGTVFTVIDRVRLKLQLNLTLRLIGPFEDPNQLMMCSGTSGYCSSRVSDRVYDRIPPAAILNTGARLWMRAGATQIELSANAYNLLNGKNYTSDPMYDLGAAVEMLPTPAQRFYFFLEAKLQI